MTNSLTSGEMVNGKKHGYWVTYYANGNKRSEGRYIAGKKEGLWIQYHKSGNKATEATFRDGKHEGAYRGVCKVFGSDPTCSAPHPKNATTRRKTTIPEP